MIPGDGYDNAQQPAQNDAAISGARCSGGFASNSLMPDLSALYLAYYMEVVDSADAQIVTHPRLKVQLGTAFAAGFCEARHKFRNSRLFTPNLPNVAQGLLQG